MTNVLFWPSPIHAEPLPVKVVPGTTLSEIARTLKASATATAKISGELLDRALWPTTKIADAPVTIYNRPENIGQIIGTVALIAIAAAAGPFGTFVAGAAGGGLLGSIAGGLASAAFSVAGNLLVTSLFPPSKANADTVEATPSFSIGAVRNQTRIDQPIPLILGRIVAAPDVMAAQTTYFEEREEYLQAAFCHGYGPLAIRELKLGNTPLTTFEGVERENVQAFSDPRHDLYSKDTSPEFFTVALEESVDNERTTAPDTRRAFLDFVAPAGIFELTDRGKVRDYPVTLRVQYRETGTTPWIEHSAAYKIASLQRDAIRQTLKVVFPAVGQYDIRITRLTPADGPDDKHTYQSDLTWAALKSEQQGAPFNFDYPVAATFCRIKATGQLNGPLERLNAEVTSIGDKWNSATQQWDAGQEITNNADLVRLCLQHPANPKAVADEQIDLPSLQAWSEYCDAKGWTYGQRRDSVSSWDDVIADICAAGRAVHIFANNKHSFVFDDDSAPVVHHFTPQNSSGFTVDHAYPDPPHALKVRFFDEDDNYTQQDRIVYAAGYDESNATLFERLELPGITNADHAWKFGRYYLNELILRPETLTLQCDWESLDFTYGARVAVTHDVIAVGRTTGRVKGAAGSDVTLDTPVTMAGGESYGLVYKLDNGVVVTRAVTYEAGEHTTITLSDAGVAPADQTTFGFGPLTSLKEEYRVRRVVRDGDFGAQVELVNHNPAITSEDAATPDAWAPSVTSQVEIEPRSFSPSSGSAVEFVRKVNSEFETVVRLSWTPPEFGPVSFYEVLVVDTDGISVAGQTTTTGFEIAGLLPGNYTFRIAASFTGVAGLSAALTISHTVTGDEVRHRAPEPPAALAATGKLAGIQITWALPDGPDLRYVEILTNTVQDTGTATVLAQVAGTSALHEDLGVTETRYYWARTVTNADVNNTSALAGPVSATTRGVTSPLLEDGSVLLGKLASETRDHIDDADQANADAIIAEAASRTSGDAANAADILSEAAARVSGDSLNAAAIASEETTRADADSALASNITTLFSETATNAAAIVAETTARTDAISAEATARQAVAADVATNAAAITSEATARSDADNALAADITSLTATVGSNTSAISAEQTARSDADSALASDITALTATVSGNTVSIQTEASVRAAADQSIFAEKTVTFDVNGRVTGYGVIAGAKFTEFGVRTDRFTVARPDGTGSKSVFVIGQVDGVDEVALSANLVVDGSIIGRHVATETLNSDHIQAGSLQADRIEVGGGGNLLYNTDFADGLESWLEVSSGSAVNAETSLLYRTPPQTYTGNEYPTIYLYQNGTSADGGAFSDIRHTPDFREGANATRGVPVRAGEWMEASCRLATINCSMQFVIYFYDAAGVYLQVAATGLTAYPGSSSDPNLWSRPWLLFQVPAGAATAVFSTRKSSTTAGTASWLFIHQPQMCYSHAEAVAPAPYTNGGVSMIAGGRIKTDAIETRHLQANVITANEINFNAVTSNAIATNAVGNAQIATDAVQNAQIAINAVQSAQIASSAVGSSQLASNAVTSGKIVSNAITTTKITGNAITTPLIAANAVTTNEIAANAVTANEANFTTLTALNLEVQTAEIANLAVANGKIADEATTAFDVSGNTTTASYGNYGANTWGNVVAITVVVDHSGQLKLDAYLKYENTSGSIERSIRIRVSVDNVGPSHSRRDEINIPASTTRVIDFSTTRTIAPGAYAVRLQAQTEADVQVQAANLQVLQVKK